ncbi:hypothetical protein BU15DRAFT_81174 [Melanogaster broomeanus]|nr:hypothetical protein BU15DRAFT_81174 [Melanogaster broomeanus]
MEADTTSKSVMVIAEAQARIDHEVAVLRNALLPVSRLPREILAIIFLYQAHSLHQDLRYSGMRGAPPWANVSYTCHHWRNVALSCPSLWSFLFTSCPRWTEELLSRSKTVPFRISLSVGCGTQEEMIFFEKVTTDVTRIQDLSLKLPRNLAEEVFSKLSTPAPLLHTLRLFVTKTGAESMLVPDTLFNRETPALRTLELYRCHISWSSPTLTKLIAMLRHIPGIAHLYLENALPGDEDTLASWRSDDSGCMYPECLDSKCSNPKCPDSNDPISKSLDLPHLSRLALVAPFSAVVAFLSNVTVPAKTELRLCCRHDVDFTESYTPLYPLLKQRFNTTSDVGPVIRTLNIKTTEPDVGIVLSTSERDCDVPFYSTYGQRHLHEDWGRGIPLKLDIEFEPIDGDCRPRLMRDICRTIPMVHLRTLAHFATTDLWGPLDSWVLETSFGNLQELRFIKLVQVSMTAWISALSPGFCQDELSVKRTGDNFAPALAELQVTAVAFAYNCRGGDCDGSAWCLHEALARRKAKGYTLKKLVVADSSYVSDAQVKELRKVVDEGKTNFDVFSRLHLYLT